MTVDWQPHPKGFLCCLSQTMCALTLSLSSSHCSHILVIIFSSHSSHCHTSLQRSFTFSPRCRFLPMAQRIDSCLAYWFGHSDVETLTKVSSPFVTAQNVYIYTCHPVISFEYVNPQPITMIIRPCCLRSYIPVIGIQCYQTKFSVAHNNSNCLKGCKITRVVIKDVCLLVTDGYSL